MKIEEKAKAYDELRKKIAIRFGSNVADEIFSEYEESEDERIRKSLLDYLHTLPNHFSHNGSLVTDWIAWLEKQGEHANFRNKIQIGDKVTRNQDGVLVNLSQLKRVAKPAEEYNITGIGSKNAQGKLGEMIKRKLEMEKQGEQKSADKVEPKFEIGDLITNGILIGKIDEINEHSYHAYFGDHYADVPDVENWHKWTIKDAKDGDVLVYRDEQWVFLYKDRLDDKTFRYYALVSEKGLMIDDAAYTVLLNSITPATKEQRELLFQKMKEAGYEWDAEKKELKKIEQKPTWSEGDDIMANDICYALRCQITYPISRLQSMSTWINNLKDRVRPQPKQEWSEEDSPYYDDICEILINLLRSETANVNKTAVQKDLDWLKSLKERYIWKPSDEQMDALHYVTNFDYGGYKATLVSLYEQLKKLKG